MNTIANNNNSSDKSAIATVESPSKADSPSPLLQMATPLVSVVIPVYNGAKYIQIAIDSVLEQTYSNYEIIVVDDGSTDDTRQKLQPYKSKIRYIYQENQGSAAARNVGIDLAKGELIAFLDADDFWTMPEKLAKQVALFDKNSSLGCINTGWKIVDGAGKHIKTVQPWHKAPKLDLETWLKKKCVRTSAMVFRKHWLEKVGGFDEELRQSHDVDLALRLSLAGCETVWLKDATVCYRQHEHNTTKNSLKQAKYVQMVLDKFFARPNLPESVKKHESQTRYHTLVWLAWYQYRAGNLDKMAKFLQKSLDFSPYFRVENISHWLTAFRRFSEERGKEFQTDVVTSLPQWHQLIVSILGLPTVEVSSVSQETSLLLPVSPTAEKQIIPSSSSIKVNLANSQHTKSSAELTTMANKKLKQQELEAATDLYSQALEIEPNAWKIHRELGKIYYKQGQLDLSLTHFQKTIEIKPDIGEVHTDIGQTLAQLEKLDEAIAAYKRGIEIKPEQPWSYFKLAALQEKQYNLAAAAVNLQKAIEYDPNNSVFHRNLARVQQLKKFLNAGSPVKKISTFSSANNHVVCIKVFPARESFLLPSISNCDTPDELFSFAQHATPESYVSIIKQGRGLIQQEYSCVITYDNSLVEDLCVNLDKFDESRHLPKCHRLRGSVVWLSLANIRKKFFLDSTFDLLARIELLKLSGIDLGSVDYFIVDRADLEVAEEILKLTNFDLTKVLVGEEYSYVSADTLFVPSFAFKKQKISKWACESMRKTIASQVVENQNDLPELIYVKSGIEAQAKLKNESEIIKFVENHKFTAVCFDSISLLERILYIKTAKAIITANKNALDLIYFCNIGCKVIELCSKDRTNIYWLLSNISSLEHYHLVADNPEDKANDVKWFSVNVQFLKKVLIKSNIIR